MSRDLSSRHFVSIAAVGLVVLIAALAVIDSQRDKDAVTIAPLGLEEVDALVSQLARCRTVTLDDTASLENCRRVWKESRRQFFGPSRIAPSFGGPVPTASNDKEKNQDRVSPGQAKHQQNGVR